MESIPLQVIDTIPNIKVGDKAVEAPKLNIKYLKNKFNWKNDGQQMTDTDIMPIV